MILGVWGHPGGLLEPSWKQVPKNMTKGNLSQSLLEAFLSQKMRSDFFLELYLLLPLFLLRTAATEKNITRRLLSSLCGGAAMTRRRRLQLFTYVDKVLTKD